MSAVIPDGEASRMEDSKSKVDRGSTESYFAELDAADAAGKTGAATVTPDSIRMAATMVATLPIIMVYPFIQKYFVKGIMLGAVKG